MAYGTEDDAKIKITEGDDHQYSLSAKANLVATYTEGFCFKCGDAKVNILAIS